MSKHIGNFVTYGACVLFLIFLMLKVYKVISWSWWYITAPLWGLVTFIALLVLVILIEKINSRK